MRKKTNGREDGSLTPFVFFLIMSFCVYSALMSSSSTCNDCSWACVGEREDGAARRCCLFCCETCLYGRCLSLVARLLEQGEHILLVCLDTRLVEGVDTKQLS